MKATFPWVLLLILTLSGFSFTSLAQIEYPGTLRDGSLYPGALESTVINVVPPDRSLLEQEDLNDASMEKPYRIGVTMPVWLRVGEGKDWVELSNGGRLWITRFRCEGAEAVGLDYSDFTMPPGAELYISSADFSTTTGAFTSINNTFGQSFSTRPVRGDELVIEYYQPANCHQDPEIVVDGLIYIYRGWKMKSMRSADDFGGSGPCEVNVSCNEGNDWKNQSKGVVRILSRVRNQTFWCSGSLVNNTTFDYAPLILTANHCSESIGSVSSPSDLNKWIFYFNYQSTTCADPLSEPTEQSMVGGVKLAASTDPFDIGSDFYLLRLKQMVPYDSAYYNGWSRADLTSTNGVGIHHPEGDIKKISTYTKPLQSGSWQTTPGTHWIVKWSETANGFGVTEGGSSGSPIFDKNGLVVGTLTGGESSCSNTNGADYYGKFSYSWESNGTADSTRLAPWLDPLNEGRISLEGTYNDKMIVADFEADTTIIPVGESLDFQDRSVGNPTNWNWTFEGGEPSTSTDRHPKGITYNAFGTYTVKLNISNQFGEDSLIRQGYIDVKALLYPNPTDGEITIFTQKDDQPRILRCEVYNISGVCIDKKEIQSYSGSAFRYMLPRSGNLFFIRLTDGSKVQVNKIVVVNNKND